jgi:hypothetical protein
VHDDPLGDPFTVEVLHLLHDRVVEQHGRPRVSEYSSLGAAIPESVVVGLTSVTTHLQPSRVSAR